MAIPSGAERQKKAIAFGQRFLHHHLMVQGKTLGHGGVIQPDINRKGTPAMLGFIGQVLQRAREGVVEQGGNIPRR